MDGSTPNTVYLDPSGDLKIILDHHRKREQSQDEQEDDPVDKKVYVVSSQVLCLASPVWKAMFSPDGRFLEADKSATFWEVKFEDDDPEALLLVLRIAHLHFRDLPEELEFKELLNLAVICDKYDTVRLVRPWLSQWAGLYKPMIFFAGWEEWLFIAWTFGDTETYKKLASLLVSKLATDESGQCLRSGDLVGATMPPGAMDTILEARRVTIVALLKMCEDLVDRYQGDGLVCSGLIKRIGYDLCTDFERRRCDTLMLGSLVKGLKRAKLWPQPLTLENIYISVSDMCNNLRALPCLESEGEANHSSCKFTTRMNREINDIETSVIPSGVEEVHIQHMLNQAQK